MNKKYVILFFLSLSLLVSGCATWWKRTNPNTNQVNNAQQQVQDAKDALNQNGKDKMKQIQSTASGVDYALSKVTNASPAVTVAKELNDRTVSIAGVPSVDELNKMKKIVDDLTSQVVEEQKRGKKSLEEKDKEILSIQQEREQLKQELKQKEELLQKTAEQVAKKADEYKSTVDEVNSWFGLGGVIFGVKKFVKTCLVFILVFGILFLALRVFATVNPIAGAAFSIFEMIGGVILQSVKALIPNSINIAKVVDKVKFDEYKSTLSKIVDTIQECQSAKDKGGPSCTVDNLLEEFSKSMSDHEKDLIKSLKKELRW